VEPCDSPALDSLVCGTCLHGSERGNHVREYQTLISAFAPIFLYPSECARQVFEKSGIAVEGPGRVVPHMQVAQRVRREPVVLNLADENQAHENFPVLRIAFCGHPVAHKGYVHFKAIANRCLDMTDLAFFHMGETAGDAQGVKFVRTSLKDGVSEMTEKLRAEEIDVVFIGSTWRETFNFVAHEALQAGAAIITLECAGNVADLVRTHEVGLVARDWNEIVALLRQKNFHQLAESWRRKVSELEVLPNSGTDTSGVAA
jgi:hypothetical protein